MSKTTLPRERRGTNLKIMTNQEFNPADHSADALRLIMLRVQQWGCTPAEAVIRLIDEVAKKSTGKEAA